MIEKEEDVFSLLRVILSPRSRQSEIDNAMRVLRDYERLLYREHEDSDTLPEIKGTNFSSKIMEYAPIENVNSEEDDDDEFRLSLSQRFLRMFISPNTPYRSLFVFHQLGTGKTCTAIQIAEGFRSMGKRVIIISSVSLHENFKKELFEFSKYCYRVRMGE